MTALPAPPPVLDEDNAEFWAATQDGVLLLRRCAACGRCMWYPRPRCPLCHSTDTAWIRASGRGVLYSFTAIARGTGAYADTSSYVVAYVELAEGPRILTNVVECDADSLEIGQAMEIVFHDTGSGSALPRFRLSGGN